MAVLEDAEAEISRPGKVFPGIAGMTSLKQCLPPRYLEGTSDEIATRLRDPKARREIRRNIQDGLPGWNNNEMQESGGWHGVMLASVQQPENKRYEGEKASVLVDAEMKEDSAPSRARPTRHRGPRCATHHPRRHAPNSSQSPIGRLWNPSVPVRADCRSARPRTRARRPLRPG